LDRFDQKLIRLIITERWNRLLGKG